MMCMSSLTSVPLVRPSRNGLASRLVSPRAGDRERERREAKHKDEQMLNHMLSLS